MQPKILLVHTGNETFVKLDRDILSTFANVHDYYARRKFPFELSRCWQGVKDSDAVFCWFASWNSFWTILLARLFQKPSILVIGGYDLANLPEANYGHQRGRLEKWLSRWTMKLATILITNSSYSQQEAEQNAGVPSKRVRVIYHGLPDAFGALPAGPKENMALTVGGVDWSNLKRKGLEPFVRAAQYLPATKFVVIGVWADNSIQYLRSIASPNVLFTGRVTDEELFDYYQRASVYVQASLHEGFGMSVAEAMLAGCIPVVTRHGALPEVVGDSGFYAASLEPPELAKVMEIALCSPTALREEYRQRILSHFPISQRRESLRRVVFSIWSDQNAET
jgi:glycosyltransferase involved in cell wall biosynthesis